MKIKNVLFIALSGAASVMAQTSALTSFVDTHGIEHVFYEDSLQNIQELNRSGEWSLQIPSPTQQAGAPPTIPGSPLTGFYDSFGIQHVFYLDTGLNVRELYNFNSRWWKNQLTGAGSATDAPPAVNSFSLASCFDKENVEHVFYIDSVNHVRELFNNGQWGTHDITAQTETPTGTAASPLTSYCDSSGNANVFTVLPSADNNNIEWFHVSGGDWAAVNITAATNGPVPNSPNKVTSFFDTFGIGHVFYFDTAQNVWELYQENGRWFGNDPGLHTNSPAAVSNTGLTSYFDTFETEHVFYADTNNHVRELYHNTLWGTNDWSADTGGPLPGVSTALTSFFDSQGDHVFYVDGADHIIELSFLGVFGFQDVTAAAAAPLAMP